MPESLDGNEYPYQHAEEKNREETDLNEHEDSVAVVGSLDGLIVNLTHFYSPLRRYAPVLSSRFTGKNDGRQSAAIPTLHVDHFLDPSCRDKGSGKITSAGVEVILGAFERRFASKVTPGSCWFV